MQNPPTVRLTATTTDRLTAIHALASMTKVPSFEAHAGIVARLLNSEDYETVEFAFNRLDSDDAVEALEINCKYVEEKFDLYEYGARQDRDTGMWDNTANYDEACNEARETAAQEFITQVRDGLVKDLHELTPARLAVKRANEIAMAVNGQVAS